MKTTLLADVRPFILGMNDSQSVFSIVELGENIQISCEPWTYMRSTQIATLYINDEIAGSAHLPPVLGRLATPHAFHVPVHTYFEPGELYRISIVVTEPDGSATPNQSRSQTLEISVTD